MIRTVSKEALDRYEGGLRLLFEHRYAEALKAFTELAKAPGTHPLMKNRAEAFVKTCTLRVEKNAREQQETDDWVATVIYHVNRGEWVFAEEALKKLQGQKGNDFLPYLAAVVACGKGDLARARTAFAESVELDPENRRRGRHDPDLEPIRGGSAGN